MDTRSFRKVKEIIQELPGVIQTDSGMYELTDRAMEALTAVFSQCEQTVREVIGMSPEVLTETEFDKVVARIAECVEIREFGTEQDYGVLDMINQVFGESNNDWMVSQIRGFLRYRNQPPNFEIREMVARGEIGADAFQEEYARDPWKLSHLDLAAAVVSEDLEVLNAVIDIAMSQGKLPAPPTGFREVSTHFDAGSYAMVLAAYHGVPVAVLNRTMALVDDRAWNDTLEAALCCATYNDFGHIVRRLLTTKYFRTDIDLLTGVTHITDDVLTDLSKSQFLAGFIEFPGVRAVLDVFPLRTRGRSLSGLAGWFNHILEDDGGPEDINLVYLPGSSDTDCRDAANVPSFVTVAVLSIQDTGSVNGRSLAGLYNLFVDEGGISNILRCLLIKGYPSLIQFVPLGDVREVLDILEPTFVSIKTSDPSVELDGFVNLEPFRYPDGYMEYFAERGFEVLTGSDAEDMVMRGQMW